MNISGINGYIYSFHMPLFAFIGGFFFRPTDLQDFVKKKSKRLLIPFFFYSTLCWIIYTVIIYFNHPDYLGEQIKKIIWILAGSGQNGIVSLGLANVVMWFIPYLFVTELLFWVIHRLFPDEKKRILCVLVCMVMGSVLCLKNISLPYSFDTVLLLSPFFYLGTKFIAFSKRYSIRTIFVWVLLFALLHVLISHLNYTLSGIRMVDVASGVTGNIVLFYLAAFCGILFYSLLCLKISYAPFLNYLGKNSMIIMIVHIPIIQLYSHFSSAIPVLNNPVIKFSAVIAVSCVFIQIINKKLPWSIGLPSVKAS